MKRVPLEFILLSGGAFLAVVSAVLLAQGGHLRHHRNPFAVQRSGYGMILARLSQDTVNKVWHYGIEGVNPHDHEPGQDTVHRHDHDHACVHDHENNHPHPEVLAQAPIYGSDPGPIPNELLSVAGLPAEATSGGEPNLLQSGMEFLQDLKASKYNRTNPHGLTEAHKKKVAKDIEGLLLRSYQMDPTDYGVYNSYYLFLTIHELQARPASLEQAKRIAGLSIAASRDETETPFPSLTAASALIDQLLLDQQKARELGVSVPASVLRDYAACMHECLDRYANLRAQAEARGNWGRIGAARKAEAEERYRFLVRASEQFGALLGEADVSGD